MNFDVKRARELFGITRKELYDILGLSPKLKKQFSKRKYITIPTDKLPEIAQARLILLDDALGAAILFFDNDREAIKNWMRYKRLLSLDYSTPLDYIRRGSAGIAVVRDILRRLEYGIYF